MYCAPVPGTKMLSFPCHSPLSDVRPKKTLFFPKNLRHPKPHGLRHQFLYHLRQVCSFFTSPRTVLPSAAVYHIPVHHCLFGGAKSAAPVPQIRRPLFRVLNIRGSSHCAEPDWMSGAHARNLGINVARLYDPFLVIFMYDETPSPRQTGFPSVPPLRQA